MSVTAFLLFSFTSLFAVIDPLGGIPFFSGLTGHLNRAKKRRRRDFLRHRTGHAPVAPPALAQLMIDGLTPVVRGMIG